MGEDFDKEEAIKIIEQEVDDARATEESEKMAKQREEEEIYAERVTRAREAQLRRLNVRKRQQHNSKISPARQRLLKARGKI